MSPANILSWSVIIKIMFTTVDRIKTVKLSTKQLKSSTNNLSWTTPERNLCSQGKFKKRHVKLFQQWRLRRQGVTCFGYQTLKVSNQMLMAKLAVMAKGHKNWSSVVKPVDTYLRALQTDIKKHQRSPSDVLIWFYSNTKLSSLIRVLCLDILLMCYLNFGA